MRLGCDGTLHAPVWEMKLSNILLYIFIALIGSHLKLYNPSLSIAVCVLMEKINLSLKLLRLSSILNGGLPHHVDDGLKGWTWFSLFTLLIQRSFHLEMFLVFLEFFFTLWKKIHGNSLDWHMTLFYANPAGLCTYVPYCISTSQWCTVANFK